MKNNIPLRLGAAVRRHHAAADLAGERIDAFLTSLGKLRYGLRRIEARTDPADREDEMGALRRDAQALVRDWFDPVLKTTIFDRTPSLANRPRRRINAMCRVSEG